MEPEEDSFSSGRSGRSASKLSSIFAQEPDWANAPNASLAYKGAKAPQRGGAGGALPPAAQQAASQQQQQQQATDNKGALFTSMVSLISYDAERRGTVLGSRALALMRHPSGSYLLLCYDPARPNQPDVMVVISETFQMMPQAPADGSFYAFFHDEARNSWCLKLASAEALADLARHIALIKHAANPQGVSVVTQDISINAAEPRALSNGDAVKIKYNLHLISSGAQADRELGPLLSVVGTEDKPKQLKLGANKDLLGLEQGLVGMKKGGKRVLILPASLAYGSAGNAQLGVPANAAVFLEVELLKVKHAEKPQLALMAAATPVAAPQPAPAAAARPSVIVLGGPAEAPATPADDGEKPDSRRNSLAHRMAAMGGFAMPNMNPVQQQQHVHHAQPAHVAPGGAGEQQHEDTQTPQPAMQQQQQPQQQQQHQPQMHQQGQMPQQQPPFSQNNSQSFQPGQQQQQSMGQMHQQPSHMQQHGMQGQMQQQQHGMQPQQHQPAMYGSPYPQSSPSHIQSPQHANMYGNNPQTAQQMPLQGQQQQQAYNQYGQPQQQHAFGLAPGGPMGMVPLQSLEAKIDAIQLQLGRCLGSQNAYDPNPTLNGSQMLRGLTTLIEERDALKAKSEESAKQVVELTAKISGLHERNESYLAENQKLSESRFASFSEELKLKNANITTLQDANRALQHEMQAKHASMQELELQKQKLSLELELATGQVKNQKDLDRQVTLLSIQLEESKKSTEHSTESVRLSMGQELVKLQQEAQDRATDLSDMAAKHAAKEAEWTEADQKRAAQLKQVQSTVDALEKDLATARNDLSASASLAQQREGEVKQLQLRLEHMAQESTGSAESLASASAQHEAQLQALSAELEQLKSAMQQQQQEAQEAAATAAAEAAAAQAVAVEEATEQAKADVAALFRPKLEDVVSKAKSKIESVQAELDEAVAARTELESQVASLTEEKQAIVDRSKEVIAKIRTQVQAQQAEHEEALQAAVAAASAAVSASAPGGAAIDSEEAAAQWQDKVKKSMGALYQTLAASIARSAHDQFSRQQLSELLKRDIKTVTIRALNGEEGPAPPPEDEQQEQQQEAESAPPQPEEAPAAAAPAFPSESDESSTVAASSSQAASAVDDFGPDEDEQQAEPQMHEEAAPASVAEVAEEQAPAVVPDPVAEAPVEAAAEPEVAAAAEPVVEAAPVVAASAVVAEPAVAVAPAASPASSAAADSDHEDAPVASSSKNAKKKAKKNKNKKGGAKEVAEAAAKAEEHEVAAAPVAAAEAAPAVSEPEAAAAHPADAHSEPSTVSDEDVVIVSSSSSNVESEEAASSTVAAAAAAPEPEPEPVVAAEPVPEVAEPVVAAPVAASSVVSPAKSSLFDPFADDAPAAAAPVPAVAAVVSPSAAAKKPASSLFGDDDDDDSLFPAPAPVAAKLKVEAKRSLFDDDDDGF